MSTETNIETVQAFFAAIGRHDSEGLLTLVTGDVEWIIPGEDWPLAGTHRGHAGVESALRTASDEIQMEYPEPPRFFAQGDRVFVVGTALGIVKATNKPFKDAWVFDMTVRDGKVTRIREYIDTQALARASILDVPQRA